MPNRLPSGSWVLEGIMTTVAAHPAEAPLDQRLNIAPMGPIVSDRFDRFIVRPFKSSTTYQNLKANGAGVFHVTDDVLLIAEAAIGMIRPPIQVPLEPAQQVCGLVLCNVCRYYELQVSRLDDRSQRTHIEMQVVAHRRIRDFAGFNRARHAVLEAAILATRVFQTGPTSVLAEYERLQVIVDKTGSNREHLAMKQLRQYLEAQRGGTLDGEKQP